MYIKVLYLKIPNFISFKKVKSQDKKDMDIK